jgi:DNA invertase Pin-like site-specific DNA recombinase
VHRNGNSARSYWRRRAAAKSTWCWCGDLDRWGRSVADLLATLQELNHLGVGFVSLTEALDLTTPAGRAMAGLLAVFAEFERDILRENGFAPAWRMPVRTASTP